MSYEVIGNDDDLYELARKYKYALITVGHLKFPNPRIKLFELVKKSGFILPAIISPRAHISKSVTIDEGTVIMHDALVNPNVRIGKNCIINSKALIEHDSLVGDNCHVSTGAIINGSVKVRENCFIGSNATTSQSITIKAGSFIKAGSVVK